MTPTEKRLREALEFARDKIYRALCAQGEIGDNNDPADTPTIRRIDEALAAIPSETGGDDELVKLKRDLAFKQLCIDELRDANRAFYSSHASLRERVVEECANEFRDLWSRLQEHLGLSIDWPMEQLEKRLRALAKSPPVSGEKEKSDG